jgi:hypothetical protein
MIARQERVQSLESEWKTNPICFLRKAIGWFALACGFGYKLRPHPNP